MGLTLTLSTAQVCCACIAKYVVNAWLTVDEYGLQSRAMLCCTSCSRSLHLFIFLLSIPCPRLPVVFDPQALHHLDVRRVQAVMVSCCVARVIVVYVSRLMYKGVPDARSLRPLIPATFNLTAAAAAAAGVAAKAILVTHASRRCCILKSTQLACHAAGSLGLLSLLTSHIPHNI